MNISATIKKQYLDMILIGAKTTEYREMSIYWTKRIVDLDRYKEKDIQTIIDAFKRGELALYTKPISEITFLCGKEKVTFHVIGISIYKGHAFYAIRLGKRLK